MRVFEMCVQAYVMLSMFMDASLCANEPKRVSPHMCVSMSMSAL